TSPSSSTTSGPRCACWARSTSSSVPEAHPLPPLTDPHTAAPGAAPDLASPFERFRHIVVEGPIGAGKTSLARKLAERFGAQPVLEEAMGNPFLERFYRDSRRYALPTQLFFLFQRVNQLRDLAQHDLFSQAMVGDFLLDKDPL